MSKRVKLSKDEVDEISKLPSDVMIRTLMYVEPEDIAHMCRVSRRFRAICNNNQFWGNLFTQRFGIFELDENYNMRRMYFAHLFKERVEKAIKNFPIHNQHDFTLDISRDDIEIVIEALPTSGEDDDDGHILGLISLNLFSMDNDHPRRVKIYREIANIVIDHTDINITDINRNEFDIDGHIYLPNLNGFIELIYDLLENHNFKILTEQSYRINCSICAEPAIVQCRDCPQKFCEKHTE